MNLETSAFKRYLLLFTVCTSTFMATLDGSIVNISLPVIANYFSAGINSVQWIVTSYLLTISSILLIWGRLSDIYGRRIFFAVGMAVFTLGSVLCGFSNSLGMLVFSRVVQAVGASITMALSQGIVTAIFPPNQRGKALGIVATIVAIGSLVGPSLGGVLVHWAGWRSIFFVNIPFGVAGVILTMILMKGIDHPSQSKSFDYTGSLLFLLSVVLLFVGLLSLQDNILPVLWTLVLSIAAVILMVVFIQYEKKLTQPLLELSLFRSPFFSISLVTAFISYLTMYAYIFFMPFYLQFVLKSDILISGLMMSAYPLTTGTLSPVTGWISDWNTRIPLTLIGLSISTVSLMMFTLLNEQSHPVNAVIIIVLLGIGSALFQSPNTSAIMGSVSRDKVGVAGSINALARNLGMVTGTTISVSLFMAVSKIGINNLGEGGFDSAAFLKGFHAVMANASVLAFLAVLLTGFRLLNKTVSIHNKTRY